MSNGDFTERDLDLAAKIIEARDKGFPFACVLCGNGLRSSEQRCECTIKRTKQQIWAEIRLIMNDVHNAGAHEDDAYKLVGLLEEFEPLKDQCDCSVGPVEFEPEEGDPDYEVDEEG